MLNSPDLEVTQSRSSRGMVGRGSGRRSQLIRSEVRCQSWKVRTQRVGEGEVEV